jgi:hypothetical protein
VLKHIDDVTLHYLNGYVYVEACIPLRYLHQLNDAESLKQDFNLACKQVHGIGESRLRYC